MFRTNVFENMKNSLNVFTTLRGYEWLPTISEILIIAIIIYVVLAWMKNTRAWMLLRGIVIVGILVLVAVILDFKVIIYILQNLSAIMIMAIIIIFQDDIRSGLEHLGRSNFFSRFIPDMKLSKATSREAIQEIVEASFSMGKVKTGALIVIEQNVSLEEYERTGISIDGDISRQLLINIFEKNTPLHDGAVLIVGNVIKAATCYLPLSHDSNISKDLGTRHRAAMGISEVSDSMTVIVSEETGKVSLCYGGTLMPMKDEKQLLKAIMDIIYGKEENKNTEKGVLNTMKGWFR